MKTNNQSRHDFDIPSVDVKEPENEQHLYHDGYQFGNQNNSEFTFHDMIQSFIDLYPFCVLVIDENHNIVQANKTTQKLLGKSNEEISGGYCPKVIHGVEDSYPGCPLQDALKKGQFVEKDLLDPFYSTWVSSAIYPMENVTFNGKKIFIHTAIDITNRKKTEETVLKQKDYLENILESLTQPLYVVDVEDYTVIMANSASGFGSLSKKPKCYKLTHGIRKPCDENGFICPIQEIKRTGKPVVVEHNHYDQNGVNRVFEIHGYPLFDENDKLCQIIEYTLDITKRKQDEIRFKRMQKNIEAKSQNIEEHNIALKVLLKHQDKEVNDLARNIISNTKTLLYPYLEKVKNGPLTENQKMLMGIIESNIAELIKPFSKQMMDDPVCLSPSEVLVANMIKEGKTAKEMAKVMFVSVNTIKAHTRNIRLKVNIKNKKINLRVYLKSLS